MVNARWSLIGLQVLYVGFFPVWVVFTMFSAMWFDDPAAAQVHWLVALFYLNLAYPLALIGAAVASWILYARGRYAAAVNWNLVPLLWAVPIVAIFLYANLWS